MALLSASVSALSAAGLTASLPAAWHGLRMLSRSASYLHLTAPRPAREEDAAPSGGKDAFEWTFAPFAREAVRAAGGFDGRARWPLGLHAGSGSLLELGSGASSSSHLFAGYSAASAAGCFARTYSIVPHSAQLPKAPQAAAEHTAAAAALELPAEAAAPVAAAGTLTAAWLPKAQPRLKGFSRKLVLRQVNRKIIARVARRFTIGIPVLGFYFVSKLMVKDLARVRSEYAAGQTATAALFSTALVADVLDLAAQATVISGLAHANLGVGLAGAAALLALADKASLATAALSFSCGLGGELLALKRAGEPAAEDAKSE